MSNEVEKLLMSDPIAETENLFGGKHWSRFTDIEKGVSMLNMIQGNKIKREYFEKIGDTYFGMTWDYFKNLIIEKGFINGYSYEIDYVSYGEQTKEEMIIYYNPDKGLIIYAESYNNKTSVNSGTLYGEIQANNKLDESIIWRWISTGGCIDIKNMIYETSHDIREGLITKFEILESAGKFLKTWTGNNRFLWFVDYKETKNKNYDYKEITNDKIKKCPKELQKIIGYNERR